MDIRFIYDEDVPELWIEWNAHLSVHHFEYFGKNFVLLLNSNSEIVGFGYIGGGDGSMANKIWGIRPVQWIAKRCFPDTIWLKKEKHDGR